MRHLPLCALVLFLGFSYAAHSHAFTLIELLVVKADLQQTPHYEEFSRTLDGALKIDADLKAAKVELGRLERLLPAVQSAREAAALRAEIDRTHGIIAILIGLLKPEMARLGEIAALYGDGSVKSIRD